MEHQSLLTDVHFWYAAAFVLFFVLAGRAITRALTGWLDGKIARIKSDIDEAARLRTEAEVLLQQATARHAAAQAESDAIMAAAAASAAIIRANVESETARLIARRESQVLDRIAQAEKQALADLQSRIVALAIEQATTTLAALPASARESLTTAAIDGVKAA